MTSVNWWLWALSFVFIILQNKGFWLFILSGSSFADDNRVLDYEMGSSYNGFYFGEFNLDAKWLIYPKLLFVGPKIGEGAHAK